jgi:predicted alpha/beta-hydrolase family hydrolase
MAGEAFVADGVSCRRYGDGATTLVLAHGAGAGQTHPFMVRYAEALASRGLSVVTFDFRYMAENRGAPDRMPILEQTYRTVVAAVRKKGRLAIGGKSMGGRVASMIAASDPGICDALVFLGYPLHPPKQPEKLRAAHLPKIEAPMLFVQGERDVFGTPTELAPILKDLPRAKLLVVASGDHSLSVPKRARPQSEVDADVQSAIVAFVMGERKSPRA